MEINLIGHTLDEAEQEPEKYLNRAFLAGLPRVRIIHGHGAGILRRVAPVSEERNCIFPQLMGAPGLDFETGESMNPALQVPRSRLWNPRDHEPTASAKRASGPTAGGWRVAPVSEERNCIFPQLMGAPGLDFETGESMNHCTSGAQISPLEPERP